jgi:(2Fe-2S) ferredoxin
MKYEKHIFICTNEKAPGKKCCGEARGMELVNLFKDALKERGLHITMRAQRAGCLDVCAHGPALVVYPEGVFYGNVTPEDVNRIVEEHLVNNQPVTDLQLTF